MNAFTLCVLIFLFPLICFAQADWPSPWEMDATDRCSTPNNPQSLAEGVGYAKTDERYVIPVIFHILHDNGYENLRRVEVLEILDRLNEIFNKANPDTTHIPAHFRALIGKVNVEFRLAAALRPGNGPFRGPNPPPPLRRTPLLLSPNQGFIRSDSSPAIPTEAIRSNGR